MKHINNYITKTTVIIVVLLLGSITSNAQQYFKASYIDAEATGSFKGWDLSGFELTTGDKTYFESGKSFWDLGMGLSWREESVSGSASYDNLSFTGSVSTDSLALTLYPQLGYDVTNWMSLYAGPHFGVNWNLLSVSGSVTVDGTTYSGSAIADDFGYNYGYGAGVTFTLSENLGIDLGWRSDTRPDFLETSVDYESEYWHFGLYLEF